MSAKLKFKSLILFVILIALAFAGCSKGNLNAIEIKFNSGTLIVKSNNAMEHTDSKLFITEGGEYILSGNAKDFRVMVDCDDPVTLILEELNIVNKKNTAIEIVSDNAVTVESVGKAENNINVADADGTACIKSKGDLKITGDTKLNLTGYNAIKTKENVFVSGNLNIAAYHDGIKGEEIFFDEAEISILADEDGIHGSKISFVSGDIIITGTKEDSFGMYAEDKVEINGSNLNINTKKDAIYADNEVVIANGNITIVTNDDGIHADKQLEINGGNINIEQCLEGLESGQIKINGGSINITSQNDGINAAYNDKDTEKSADVYINGGVTQVNADGDGIDANGSVYINGGQLFVSGAYGGNNNAIDFDDEFLIDGGVVIVAGNNLDAKPPSKESEQNSVMIIYEDVQQVGQAFFLADEEDNLLILADFPKPYDSIKVSSGKISDNHRYYYGSIFMDELENSYMIDTKSSAYELNYMGSFQVNNTVNLVWYNK